MKCLHKKWILMVAIVIVYMIGTFAAFETNYASTGIVLYEQPQDAALNIGERLSLSVKAEGEGLTYQWQYHTASGTEWINLGSGTKSSYGRTMTGTMDGWKIRCVVTDSEGNTETTREVSVSLKIPIKITTQPQDAELNIGERLSLSVKAEGDGLTYQWQYHTASGTEWVNLGSGTKSSYGRTMTGTMDGWKIRCVVTDSEGNTETTREVSVSLKIPIKITTQPQDAELKIGERLSLSVKAEGDGLTYQWQYHTASGTEWVNLGSGTKSSYGRTMTGTMDGWKIRCVVTDSEGNTETTREVSVSLKIPIKITTQPQDAELKIGERLSLSVKAEGEGLTYQWQYHTASGTEWVNLGSGTKSSYGRTMTGTMDGWKIRCVVTDSEGNTETTREVSVSLKIPIKITTQPQDAELKIGERLSLSVKAEGEGLTYQWQYHTASGTEWVNLGSGTKSSYGRIMTGTMDNWKVRCVITDSTGNSITSDIVTITIQKEPVITSHTITYDANGGYFDNDLTTDSETAENGLYYIGHSDPVRPGYNFLGWKTDIGTGPKYLNRITLKDTLGDIMVYAQWEKVYTVTFDANGGYFYYDGENEISAISVTADPKSYALTALEPADPVREGYDFIGWKVDGRYASRITVDDDITITADWEKLITITYDANGGAFADETTQRIIPVYEGYQYISCEAPEREGYSFQGWVISGRSTNRLYVASDITVKAKWERIVTVTLDADSGEFSDGTSQLTVSFSENETVNLYSWEQPTREGYYFRGWTLDGENRIEDITLSEEGLTFHALWQKTYTVTLDPNGGYFDMPEDDSSTIEMVMTEGDYFDPYSYNWAYRSGYEFRGWSLNGTDPLDNGFTVEEDVTLYAVWVRTYIITFDANGGYFETPEENSSTITTVLAEGDYFDPVSYYGAYRDDYEFRGWSLNGIDLLETGFAVDGDITVYAVWSKWCTVTFDAGEGTFEDGISVFTYPDPVYTIWNINALVSMPEREGYRFAGWNLNGQIYSHNDSVEISDDATFEAVWEKQHLVTLDANGGYFFDPEYGDQDTFSFYVNDGDLIELSFIPDNDLNMNFLYWKVNGEDYVEELEVHEDVTAVAQWRHEYMITFNSNGGDLMGVEYEYEYHQEGSYSIPTNYIPYKDNSVFLGWTYEGEFLSRIDLHSNIELVAAWEDEISVTYDANGGTIYGQSFYLADSAEGLYDVNWVSDPYREGYTFLGWTYDGDYISKIRLTESITVVAQWERDNITVVRDLASDYYPGIGNGFKVIAYGEDLHYQWYYCHPDGEWTAIEDNDSNTYAPQLSVADDGMMVYCHVTDLGTTRDNEWDSNTATFHWNEEVARYQVTYSAGSGAFSDGSNQIFETTAEGNYTIDCERPTWEGYRFIGWNLNGELLNDYSNIYVGEDVTLYAEWEKEPYKITFYDEGSVWYEFYRNEGEIVGLIGDFPEKENYEFIGWEYNGTIYPYADYYLYSLDAYSDMEFFAVYKERVFTVTYNANGGAFPSTGESYWETEANIGSYTVSCEEPVMNGATFNGWKLDAYGETVDTLDLNYSSYYSWSVTLYADWISEEIMITSISGDRDITDDEMVSGISVRTNISGVNCLWQRFNEGTGTWEDWDWGFNCSVSFSYGKVEQYRAVLSKEGYATVTSDPITVTSVVAPIRYMGVSSEPIYLTEGSNAELYVNVDYGTTEPYYQWQCYNEEGDVWEDIDGDNFSYYYTPSLSSGTYYYRVILSKEGAETVISDTITVQVIAEIPSYSVTYDAKDGWLDTGESICTEYAEEGGYYIHYSATSDTGTFIGWVTDDTGDMIWANGEYYEITHDTTFYAQYESFAPIYLMSDLADSYYFEEGSVLDLWMDVDGGSGNYDVEWNVAYPGDDAYHVETTGHEFLLETMNVDQLKVYCRVRDLSTGDEVQSTIANIYKIGAYTVCYDLQGGYFSDGSTEYSEQATYGNFTIQNSEPALDGYVFGGWQDANGNIYYGGDAIWIEGSTTITALWNPVTLQELGIYALSGETLHEPEDLWINSLIIADGSYNSLEYSWEQSMDGENWYAAPWNDQVSIDQYVEYAPSPGVYYYRLSANGWTSNVLMITVEPAVVNDFCEYGCPGPEHEPGCPYYAGDPEDY